MFFLEVKYLNLLSSRLEKFKEISHSPLTVNFRCPLCGDSQKSSRRARAYVYERDGSLLFYCHNCGASTPFWSFLADQSSALYAQYKLDWLRSKGKASLPTKPEPSFKTNTHFEKPEINLGECLTGVKDDHPVKQYVIARKIPESFWGSLYACSDITAISTQMEQYKGMRLEKDPALIIPFFNPEREYSYISARSIEPGTSFRYCVFEVNENLPKLWGLEFIDWSQRVFVFEGPIDAMCCPNSLSLAGSMGSRAIQYISEHINRPQDVCFVYDNEAFSNHQISKQMRSRIEEGFSTIIYDRRFSGKDANEVIVNETMTFQSLLNYLNERTFHGLKAKAELARLNKPKNR
jgi:hypothetical protein